MGFANDGVTNKFLEPPARKEILQNIENMWNNNPQQEKYRRERKSELRKMINNDEDKTYLSAEIMDWLNNAIFQGDEIFRRALAVLTVLSVTRCFIENQHQWKIVSEKLFPCLPSINLSNNPLKEYKNHLRKNTEDWGVKLKRLRKIFLMLRLLI